MFPHPAAVISKPVCLLQILVWPGNPGAAGYYVPFMEAVSQALEGHASVAAVSNLGQCTDGIRGQVPRRTYGCKP